MAMDMFLKIAGLEGEAQDKSHKNEIDVLAWSWGMSNSGTFHTGGGGGGGKVNVQDLSVTKWIDKASPTLMLYCATGDQFTKARLTVRKAGGKEPLEYLIVDMTDVLITSISTGGSGGEDKLTENISLNFRKFEVAYTVQKPDGSADGAPLTFAWDIAANTKG